MLKLAILTILPQAPIKCLFRNVKGMASDICNVYVRFRKLVMSEIFDHVTV